MEIERTHCCELAGWQPPTGHQRAARARSYSGHPVLPFPALLFYDRASLSRHANEFRCRPTFVCPHLPVPTFHLRCSCITSITGTLRCSRHHSRPHHGVFSCPPRRTTHMRACTSYRPSHWPQEKEPRVVSWHPSPAPFIRFSSSPMRRDGQSTWSASSPPASAAASEANRLFASLIFEGRTGDAGCSPSH